ncbi:putative galactose oxidase/kelch, beta-propeller, F-box associated interaction [Medicago truncatula]|uniref:Putative galactose oxidase/kelch, beta-propeller, F-box associated interaction n=1 Tax=Medicago truncatula TaxID=3880 RepID=A0A396HMM3_MEDTR|nr:putative galactose oxidase/kelch, beta-propeller, F-box associated interaction [Medicago truncatula]
MPNGSRSVGMSVSLAGLYGHVVGGCVACPLVGASPVNVVVSSFLANEQSEQKLRTRENEVTSTLTPMAAAPVSTAGQLLASSVGAAFTPHIIIVNAGEVISQRVLTTAGDSNEQNKSGHWLPTDVLFSKIFTDFPSLGDIRSWKMVCKEWNFVASHRKYARWHSNHASQGLLFMDAEEEVPHVYANSFLENINHPYTIPIYSTPWIDGQINSRRFKISNSIGGLVGLYNGLARDPVLVWNPITGVYHRVPGMDMDPKTVVVALGCQEDSSCYKLVRISSLDFIFDHLPPVIEVFTLGTQGWRVVEGGPNFVYVKPHPVCINGCIYFLVTYEDDPPLQIRLVCFNVKNENFVDQVLPQDPNHPEASFTRRHVSIGVVDGLLYILKCEWQGGHIVFEFPNIAFIEANVRVWVFENDAWRVLIDNVRVDTNFRCPQLFQSPRRERSYIIYTQNTNRMVIFEGAGVPLKRYHLHSRMERSYTAVQHTPSLLPMNESLALTEIETERYLSLHYKI